MVDGTVRPITIIMHIKITSKLLLTTLVIAMAALSSRAEVNLRFQLGGMYQKIWNFDTADYDSDELDLKKEGAGNIGAGLFLQIPVGSQKRFFIETGLNYLLTQYVGWDKDEEGKFEPKDFWKYHDNNYWQYRNEDINYFEIPVKIGYFLPVSKKGRFEFAAGPYASVSDRHDCGDSFSVGLTVSAMFRYRCMSYGLQWENPVFYNGPMNIYKNTFQVTIGINFSLGGMRHWDWNAIADGMAIAGDAMQVIADQYAASQGGSDYGRSDYGESDYSDSSSDSYSSDDNKSRSDSKGFSLSEHQNNTSYVCSACDGSGITTCLLCGGVGGFNQTRYLTYPPYSAYLAWIPCVACGGGGAVCCTWCGGTGEISTNSNSNQYNYNNYNDSGSSSSSTYSTCRVCGGSGVCTSCGGTGGEWRDTGYYTGSDSKSWIECSSCRGGKKCFNCHGTGKQ